MCSIKYTRINTVDLKLQNSSSSYCSILNTSSLLSEYLHIEPEGVSYL